MVNRMLELVRPDAIWLALLCCVLLHEAGFRAKAAPILRLWRKGGLKVPQKK